MAVISKLDHKGQDITRYNNATIRNINIDGVDFHFAKNTETTAVCENAVNEPIIDMQIQGNSIQNGTPTLEAPIEIQSVGERTKNLVNIPIIDSSTGTKTISCYIDKTISFSSQEHPTLIARDDGTEASVWRIAFKRLDGSMTYAVDSALQGEGTTLTSVTADNPIVSIEYRSTYIREGAYKGIQIEYGREITEFEPYGYKIPINLLGKNLVDVSSNKNTYGYLDSNGNIVSHSGIKYTDFIGVGNATRITFSGMASNGMSAPSTCFYDENKSFISGVAFGGVGEKTIDVPENAKYFRTCFRTSYTEFMGEFGAVATDYVEYIEPTITDIYIKEPLRMINDIADTLDYKNKKVIRNVGSVIYDATESWSKYDSGNGYMETNNIFPDGKPVLCNMFVNSQTLIKTLAISKNYANIYVYGVYDYYPTQEDWHAFLAKNNMEVIGQLVTPTEEEIEIPEIMTLDGTTNFEIATKLEPSGITINYWKQI